MTGMLIYDRRAIASLIKALNPGLSRGRTRCPAIFLREDGFVDAFTDAATAAVHIHMGHTMTSPDLASVVDADDNLGLLTPGVYGLRSLLTWTTPGTGYALPRLDEASLGRDGVPTLTAVDGIVAPLTHDPRTWERGDNRAGLGVDAAILAALAKIKWHYPGGRRPGTRTAVAPRVWTRWGVAWEDPKKTNRNALTRLLLWSGDDFRALVMPVRWTD